MAGTDLYSCATPATSTASSTEPSSQKTQPPNRLLQALCVFQHLSNPEVLKSVQLYSENGSMSAIQQELTFSPNGYAQISEPIPSYFSKYSAIDSEDFFNTLKKINEIDLWTCIFEYHKHRVPATIPHLLSVSNNPLLQSLPCLAYDLMLVEKEVQTRAACDLTQLLVPQPRLEVDPSRQDSLHLRGHLQSGNNQPSPQARLLQSPTKWSLSAVSVLTGHSEHTEEGSQQRDAMMSPGGNDALSQQESEVDELGNHGHDIEMHPVETNLHEWGSDLELASPRIFHPCQLGSSWSTSTMAGVPFQGLSGLSPAGLSPTSSMVTTHKGAPGLDPNCTSWNSSLFIAPGDHGYPLDPSSSFSNHTGLTPLKPLNGEFPNSPVSPGSLLESSVSSILVQKHMRHLNPAGHLERLVDRCPSHCSDESVGTPLGALRIGQAESLNHPVGLSLQPLGNSSSLQLGGDKEGSFMYRDLGLAGYSLEGPAGGCPTTPRNFSGLQQEDFSNGGCARLSTGQAEDFGAGRLEMYHGGGQIDNFGGCQSETFSGFQTEEVSMYAPRNDTFPTTGHAGVFWNENFLKDCRNEGVLRDTGGRTEPSAAYLHDGRLCHEEQHPMQLRGGGTSRTEPGGHLLRDDGFSLNQQHPNRTGAADHDMGYFMQDSTGMGNNNISTRNMLHKVSGSGAHGHHSNQRGPSERMTEITLAELSHYFNMPITQASKELKVGLTVLKKRCREFGIPRWPHRKMKSLDSLIHNIQELAKGPEGQTSVPVQNAVRELECQKKRMEERPGIELAERTKRLRQACFKASYKKRRQAQLEAGMSHPGGPARQSKSSSTAPCYDNGPSSSGARSGSVDQCNISVTMVS